MARTDVKQKLDVLGNRLVSGFQLIALFVIGATIVWSAASDYVRMGSIFVLTLAALVVLLANSRFATTVEGEKSRSRIGAKEPVRETATHPSTTSRSTRVIRVPRGPTETTPKATPM